MVVNASSRNGAADLAPAIERLQANGVAVVQQLSCERDVLCAQLVDAQQGLDCIIVGGGDGTLNAVAPALLKTGLPLGILPMGTANDLARTLGIPNDLMAATQVIIDDQRRRIDLATVNGRHFFNVANIGLGVTSRHQLSPALKQRLGIVSYAGSVLKALRGLRSFHIDLTIDGECKRMQSIQIAVGNGRHYGGGLTIADAARIDDQLFFVYSLEPMPWYRLIGMIPALWTGRFRDRHPLLHGCGRQVEIVTRSPKPISADGELVGQTPARFDILAAAVTVLAPPVATTSSSG